MVTPLVAALRRKHFRIAELLHRHGADVNIRDKSNGTFLQAACIDGIPDIVQWLLNHGADVNMPDDGPCFPIHSAAG
jgi:ankyrin repeat protein